MDELRNLVGFQKFRGSNRFKMSVDFFAHLILSSVAVQSPDPRQAVLELILRSPESARGAYVQLFHEAQFRSTRDGNEVRFIASQSDRPFASGHINAHGHLAQLKINATALPMNGSTFMTDSELKLAAQGYLEGTEAPESVLVAGSPVYVGEDQATLPVRQALRRNQLVNAGFGGSEITLHRNTGLLIEWNVPFKASIQSIDADLIQPRFSKESLAQTAMSAYASLQPFATASVGSTLTYLKPEFPGSAVQYSSRHLDLRRMNKGMVFLSSIFRCLETGKIQIVFVDALTNSVVAFSRWPSSNLAIEAKPAPNPVLGSLSALTTDGKHQAVEFAHSARKFPNSPTRVRLPLFAKDVVYMADYDPKLNLVRFAGSIETYKLSRPKSVELVLGDNGRFGELRKQL